MYQFDGKDMKHKKITNKMKNISAYLNSEYKKDDSINTIRLIPNTVFNMKDINELVNVYIPNSKYKNTIKGIAYYPEKSGTKLIYLYNNCSKDIKQVENTKASIKKPIRPSKISVKDNITAVFRIKKTDIPDVYKLQLTKKITKNGKKYRKYKKYGIAYVSTAECSFFCKDMFNSIGSNIALVKCKYSTENNKWIPYEQAKDNKYPDTYSDVKNRIAN